MPCEFLAMNKAKSFLVELKHFVMSRIFLRNFSMILGSLLLLVALTLWGLGFYTKHGESIEVPNLVGMQQTQALEMLDARDLRVDTSYDSRPGVPHWEVLEQQPKPKSRVKESRTIYLTINDTSRRQRVKIYYRDVIGQHLRNAERLFSTAQYNIRIGKKEYIAGKGENTIAEVQYEGKTLFKVIDAVRGERIPKKPAQIPQGATIDLILYKGVDAEPKPAPDLLCKTFETAEFELAAGHFNIGSVQGDISIGGSIEDTLSGYIWKQSPRAGSEITMGQNINLYIQKERPDFCPETE